MATVTAYDNLGFGLDMSAFNSGTGYVYLTGSYVGTYVYDFNTSYDSWFTGSPLGAVSYNVYWRDAGTGIVVEDLIYYSSSGFASIFYDNIEVYVADQDRIANSWRVTNLLSGNDILTGNGFADILKAGAGSDTLYGNGGNDQLYGESGRDIVFGDAGNDVLFGGAENDDLLGGLGADTMLGGTGDDLYTVDSTFDRVFETTTTLNNIDAGGWDIVMSSVSFSLSATTGVRFVESLLLTGSLAINGTGNALANRMTGNNAANGMSGLAGNDVLSGQNGNDRLNGGLGKDTLTGGLGSDIFIFSDTLGVSNIDRITDYNVITDTIQLENAIFRGMPAGMLAAAAFRANTTGLAQDSSDRFMYETDTGRLYFDIDGVGGAARILFATLNAGLNMTANEFQIV